MKSLSHVWLFVTPWTVDYQSSQSMESSRQEYWNGLPFPSPADLLTQELNLGLLHCRQMLYCLSHKESHIGVSISPNLIPCWSLWYDKVSTDSMLEHCNLHFTKWLRKKKNLPYIATPNTGENTSQTQGVNIHKTWKVLWTWWTNM